MDRPTHSVARLTTAIVAASAALAAMFAALVLTPRALAEAPANDEYVLEIPGVRLSPTTSAGESATAPATAASNAPRLGVVGETDPPSSPLDSMISTLGSVPGALLAGLAALVALALAAPLTRPRTAPEAR
jgi:hypothetical protein